MLLIDLAVQWRDEFNVGQAIDLACTETTASNALSQNPCYHVRQGT